MVVSFGSTSKVSLIVDATTVVGWGDQFGSSVSEVWLAVVEVVDNDAGDVCTRLSGGLRADVPCIAGITLIEDRGVGVHVVEKYVAFPWPVSFLAGTVPPRESTRCVFIVKHVPRGTSITPGPNDGY